MNKDSLLNKFGTIKSNLKNILLSDQELLQLLGSWEDDPLNDEPISPKYILNKHLFFTPKSINDVDSDGKTLISKEKCILMFDNSMESIGDGVAIVNIKPIVIMYNNLLDIDLDDEEIHMDRMDAIFDKLNTLLIRDNDNVEGISRKNGFAWAGMDTFTLKKLANLSSTPFDVIGMYAVYQTRIYTNNHFGEVNYAKQNKFK